jgi:hypothetical protein
MTARIRSLGAILALALALFGVAEQDARADLFSFNSSHASGSAVTVNPPLGTIDLQINGDNTQVTITFTADTSLGQGFSAVGFNYVASGGSTISTVTSSPSLTESLNSQLDGYGLFSYVFGDPSSASNPLTPITVTITGTNLALSDFENLSHNPPGDTQALFGAHFIQNSANSNTFYIGSVPGGPPTPGVPEPSTMLIAAVGALGFLGYGLRRRRKS